jgi:hypothetical protein
MSSYLNVDLEALTITFRSDDLALISHLLDASLDPHALQEGWITEANPSLRPIGFAAVFRYSRIFADFHNLPFYYRSDWHGYYRSVCDRVARHPDGHRFEAGTAGLMFEWTNLLLLTHILANRRTEELPPVELPARVHFEDGLHFVTRVADGTTLYVRPTLRFDAKLGDIPVRLHGPAASDPATPQGREGKAFLDNICGSNAPPPD